MLKGVRFISQAMVYGDREKYVVALITLNEAEVQKWASTHSVTSSSFEDLTKNAKVTQLIEEEITRINKNLASYETIKKFRLLPRDFTIESGELTPSLKLKRKVCTERYKDYIQSLY